MRKRTTEGATAMGAFGKRSLRRSAKMGGSKRRNGPNSPPGARGSTSSRWKTGTCRPDGRRTNRRPLGLRGDTRRTKPRARDQARWTTAKSRATRQTPDPEPEADASARTRQPGEDGMKFQLRIGDSPWTNNDGVDPSRCG